jgi:hypothetical protein
MKIGKGPPDQELWTIPFQISESDCYANATTDTDPDNRPPSNGPEPGEVPDPGTEPDPEMACTLVGQPVEVTTGNVLFDQTDLVFPGGGAPLVFTRSYNSKNTATGGSFGPGWTTSYENVLDVPPI